MSEQPIEGKRYIVWGEHEGLYTSDAKWFYNGWLNAEDKPLYGITAFAPLPTREQATEFKPQPQVKRYVVEVKGPHRKFTPMFLESVIESRLDAYICVKELTDPTQTPEFEALGRVVYLGMPYDTAELQKTFSDYSRSLEL